MAEQYFILDSHEARLDAATARRQFSYSFAVGFAVLAVAVLVELQPAPSTPIGAEAHHDSAVQTDLDLAAASHRRG